MEYTDAATATNALVLSHNSMLLGRNIWVAYSKNRVMQQSSSSSSSPDNVVDVGDMSGKRVEVSS